MIKIGSIIRIIMLLKDRKKENIIKLGEEIILKETELQRGNM